MSAATSTEPAVWIGCLACYNAGALTGAWFQATTAYEITPQTLHGGPTTHEELWVFDYDGLPVAEELSPREAAGIARRIAEVDEENRDAFRAWIGNDLYTTFRDGPDIQHFQDAYVGHWDSFAQYAHNLADDIGLLADAPEALARYFNWSSWTADLAHDYTVLDASEGGVYIFRDH